MFRYYFSQLTVEVYQIHFVPSQNRRFLMDWMKKVNPRSYRPRNAGNWGGLVMHVTSDSPSQSWSALMLFNPIVCLITFV